MTRIGARKLWSVYIGVVPSLGWIISCLVFDRFLEGLHLGETALSRIQSSSEKLLSQPLNLVGTRKCPFLK